MSDEERLSLEDRVARLERAVAELTGKPGARPAEARAPRPSNRREPLRSPLASKSLEWWLARSGAILTSLALLLLYQYAVERNWITPAVRVIAGVFVGAALFASARRFTRRNTTGDDSVGLREVLFGAGLAAWYITAYAAAVSYNLISPSIARIIFLALTFVGYWLSLSEHRSVLGFLSLGAGFLAPVILPSPTPNIPAFAFYAGALTAVGLVLYLMRGWLSVLWLTFIAFWWTTGEATNFATTIAGKTALSVLVVLAGAAMVRVPVLRRRLVATGSDIYTVPRRSQSTASLLDGFASIVERFAGVKAAHDSPTLWIVTIASPLLSVLVLSWCWTSVQGSAWGIASLLIAGAAYRIAMSSSGDEELTHVEACATAVWSLAGMLWLADSAGSRIGESGALMLAATSLHAVAVIEFLRESRFHGARKVALITAAITLGVVITSEMAASAIRTAGYEWPWTAAEVLAIAVSLWIWWSYREPDDAFAFPSLFGVAAFIAALLVDARILGRWWQPLVTASYAVAGTALLIAGRGSRKSRIIRRIGAFTLIVVMARLFLIDLARVETIWRVMLFMGCGALFLFTSYRLQEPRGRDDASVG